MRACVRGKRVTESIISMIMMTRIMEMFVGVYLLQRELKLEKEERKKKK